LNTYYIRVIYRFNRSRALQAAFIVLLQRKPPRNARMSAEVNAQSGHVPAHPEVNALSGPFHAPS